MQDNNVHTKLHVLLDNSLFSRLITWGNDFWHKSVIKWILYNSA